MKKIGILEHLEILTTDFTSEESSYSLLKKYNPSYIAHFASQSSVFNSIAKKEETFKVNYLDTVEIIKSIQQVCPETIFFFPSSATIYEGYSNKIVNETVKPRPLSNYAKSKFEVQKYIAKLNKNKEFNLNTGILFSHESEFRKNTFFTKMIIEFLIEYKNNNNNQLTIGDISLGRDIGYSKDYVDAIYEIMKFNLKEEFIIARNKLTKLSYFLEMCLEELEIQYTIKYHENKTEYLNIKNNKTFLISNKSKYRDFDLRNIQGDNSKINKILSWSPQTDIREMVKIMISHEYREKSAR